MGTPYRQFLDTAYAIRRNPFLVPRTSHGANHTPDSACRRRDQLAEPCSDMRRLRRNPKAVTHKAKPLPQRDVMIAGFGLGFKLWGVPGEIRQKGAEVGGAIHSGS